MTRRFLLALPAVVLAAASSGGPAGAAQEPSDDDRIYDEVRRRLTNDPDVKGGTLEVGVKQGVVTLRGKVQAEKHKVKAERLARKVKGVKQVLNQLEVERKE